MKLFYPRFAMDAIRKNKRTYIPYLLTTAFVSAMFFILRGLSLSELLVQSYGGSHLAEMLRFGSNVIAIFSLIFLFYTGSFLMKQRKQEFGLYSVLGMEKRHIAKILLFETLFIACIGVFIGMAVGAVFNWMSFLLLLNMLGGRSGITFTQLGGDADITFSLSGETVSDTLLLFAGIFLLIFLNNLRQVQFSSTISLLKSGSEGEREPKSKWPLTVLGIAFLGAGYFMAMKIENPIGAMMFFFVAVILVMLGTYCLFTSGSIVFLKFLRRRKGYYYRTNHFISVSGMLYRMKQNAVSLGNICILSTMVLVTISTTMCLYSGCDDIVKSRYPQELNITIWGSDVSPETTQLAEKTFYDMLEEENSTPETVVKSSYLVFGCMQDGSQFITDTDEGNLWGELTGMTEITLIPLSDHNAASGTSTTLAPGEALLYCPDGYGYDELSVFGKTYTVTKLTELDLPFASIFASSAGTQITLIVADEELTLLNQLQQERYKENASTICTYLGTDVSPEVAMQISSTFDDRLERVLTDNQQADLDNWFVTAEARETNKNEFIELYGGLFFIGIFLGLVFLVATILIIYYKQLSEGLQDQRRYGIMRKVGLTDKEIRSSIHSQVLTVFFLPLITAFIHTAFAFPMIRRCLNLLSMSNVQTFLICLLLCCAVFAVMYLIVYVMTSRVYYRIVNQS